MKTRSKILIAVVVAAAGAGGWIYMNAGPEPLKPGEITDDEETRRLDAGEILITRLEPTGGKGVAAMAKAVIEAPVDKVWPAVRDCEHFSKFMPRILKSELRKKKGDELLCYVEIDMPWPVDDLKAETLSKVETLPDNTFKRSWKLVSGSFEHNNGSYIVAPFKGDANRALVTYNVDVKPSIPVPDAVLKRGQSSSLPKIFVKVGERVGAEPRPK